MTSNLEQRLGLSFPWSPPIHPDVPFSPAARVDDIIYVSGQIPENGSEIMFAGQVGAEVDLADAQRAAALCAANIIHWVQCELDGDLDRVVRVAKVNIYVNAVAGFARHSQVGNGASAVFRRVFGERGEHARVALGMSGLPANVPVEVDAIIHVR